MNHMLPIEPEGLLKQQTITELRACNDLTARYGLTLSETDILSLAEKRFEALRDNDRIEFRQGVLGQLVYAFCDSPYVSQENYADTIHELMESFYYFKNESMDKISDEELIAYMKRHFDGECQGSLEYLSGTTLEELCRNTRYGYETDGIGRLF